MLGVESLSRAFKFILHSEIYELSAFSLLIELYGKIIYFHVILTSHVTETFQEEKLF